MRRWTIGSVVLAVALAGCSGEMDALPGMAGGGTGAGTRGPEQGGGDVGQPGPVGSAGAGGAWSGGSAGAGQPGSERPPEGGAAADGGAPPEPPADGGAAGQPADGGVVPACTGLDQTQSNTLYLSADDSNSMASPAIARKLIRGGARVPANLIRTYEFLNYYNVGYAPAKPGTVAIYPELRESASPGRYELQIGVAAEPPAAMRKPMTLTFVLDTSGSMQGEPIQLERAAVIAIAQHLKAGDVVSMVTWNTEQRDVLAGHVASGPNDPAVLRAAQAIDASGGTDLEGGLRRGYELASQHFGQDRLNRVVLISDGQANVGVTDADLIGRHALASDGDGIYLVGIGVGDGVNDTLMDAVTDAGRGAYVYLDSVAEAEAMLYRRFDEVMDVAARGVQVSLTMPWYMQMVRFYGEEFSGDPREVEPQHLAPGDAMVFNQLVGSCAAEHFAAEDPIEVAATFQTPITHLPRTASVQTTLGELLAGGTARLQKGSAIVAYAEALKAVQDRRGELSRARDKVMAADPQGADPDLAEIRALIERYMELPY